MVPYSLEGISQQSNLESLNLLTPPETPRTQSDESFESHLQRPEPAAGTAAPPAREEPPPGDQDDGAQTPPAANDSSDTVEPQDTQPPGGAGGGESAPADETSDEPRDSASQDAAQHDSEQDAAVVVADAAQPEEIAAETEPSDVSARNSPSRHVEPATAGQPPEQGEHVEPTATRQSRESTAEGGRQADPSDEPAVRQNSRQELLEVDAAETSQRNADSSATPAEEAITGPVEPSGTTASRKQRGTAEPRSPAANANRAADAAPLLVAARPASGPSTADQDDAADQHESQHDSTGARAPSKDGDAAAPAAHSRFAEHLLARGSERATPGSQLNSTSHSRFIERVARAFQAAETRDGTVRLRLHPPELGALRLEVKLQGGALTARLEAETPAARSLLIDNLPVLRERLAEQGVRIEQFDVDLLDRQHGGSPEDAEHQGSPERRSSGLPDSAHDELEEPGVRTSTGKPLDGDEKLDVMI